jgi:hypothetical protein
VIGSEVSEQSVVPPEQAARFLTSMWKRWDEALVEAVRAYLAGELEPGLHELGLETGSVDFSRDGGLSDEHVETLDEIRESIIAGVVDPVAAHRTPPGWNLEPAVTGLFVFDGTTCQSDLGPTSVAAGDVVRFDIINNSAVDVALAFGRSDDGVGLAYRPPLTETQTAPGGRNAVAMRLPSGSYVAVCSTGDQSLASTAVAAEFQPTGDIQGAATDPIAVVEAFAAATSAGDADGVCSLLAENLRVFLPWEEDVLEGNVDITETWTPFDDDNWFQEFVITDIELIEGVVIWSSEDRTLGTTFVIEGHRMVVEDGKITDWEWGDFVDDG